jgi:hypothetical protein
VWPTPGDHVYADVRGVFSLDHSFTPCPAPAPRHLPLPSLLPSRFPRFASCSSTDAPQVLDVFKLIDVTDDNGPIWDTRDHVVGFPYWTPNLRRYKMQHEGDSSWLNFRGLWGNRGEKDCWWHRAVDVCQVGGVGLSRLVSSRLSSLEASVLT